MAATHTEQPRFTGAHERLLDGGLRVILPKDWRSLKVTEFFLIPGSAETFIKAMPRAEYDSKVAEIKGEPSLTRLQRNTYLRDLGHQCMRVVLDSSGRLTVPSDLCKKINVSTDKPDVVLLGVVDGFEIWHPKDFAKWKQKQTGPVEAGQPRMNVQEFLGV
jgi:DNA-binding transcriptional regulator/RsmH inhibitor MraZ